MSAAVALDQPTLSGLSTPAGRRSHLRLLPAPVPTHPAGATVMVRSIRVTRRGRLLVTALTTLLVLTLVAAMSGLLPAFGGVQPVDVVVQPGQTLSEIAAVHLPGLPVGQGVVEIQLANSLSSLQVQAGQVLHIPAP